MADQKLRVVHYVNQFFGQIGGEAAADIKPISRPGPVGPGLALKAAFKDQAEIVGTVICGDNYFAENIEQAKRECMDIIRKFAPDIVVAGPAFGSGRYGMACGAVAEGVKEELSLPVVTAMFDENPGVEAYRKKVYILPTTDSTIGMKDTISRMAAFVLKLSRGQEIGFPEEEGYLAQGYRASVVSQKTGAVRAVEMMLAKLSGKPFTTELPLPVFDRVNPAPAVKDLRTMVLALVTSGGIVPKGNPDHIESHNASKCCRYDISQVNDFTGEEYESVHGGYDIVYANQDPDRVLPLDALRELEEEGVIGKIYDYYYVTVGNTTAVSSAARYGDKIGKELREAGVDAVILTST
jgi:glycine reductase